MNRNEFLDAVDTVCMNCIYKGDICEDCPVRHTVDCLYDFAPFEIWVAWEDEDCWKDYASETITFYEDNVESCFKFEISETFLNTIVALNENPIASWCWIFINGELVYWGAMGDMEIKDFIK